MVLSIDQWPRFHIHLQLFCKFCVNFSPGAPMFFFKFLCLKSEEKWFERLDLHLSLNKNNKKNDLLKQANPNCPKISDFLFLNSIIICDKLVFSNLGFFLYYPHRIFYLAQSRKHHLKAFYYPHYDPEVNFLQNHFIWKCKKAEII